MNTRFSAVPYWMPARFLLTGALALAAAGTVLALSPRLLLGHYATPAALATVHTLTLGFASITLVGAMHQLIPVVMVTQLHSARLGNVTFGLLLPGTLGVVLGFATGYRVWLLVIGGSLVVVSLLVFLYNVWRTYLTATARDPVTRAMLAAAAYLTVTAGAGLLIAASRRLPELAQAIGNPTLLHLGIGLFGTFFLAIAGAGHKLLGMFLLSHGVSQWRLRLLTYAVHLGLALLAVEAFSSLQLLPFAAGSLGVAILLFALDLVAILRKRVRRKIGLPLRLFILAPLLLIATAMLATLGMTRAAVAAMLIGFITLSIAGMYGKILGFLTWQHRYSNLVGRAPVPLLNELATPWLDRTTFWSMTVAVPLIVVTQLIDTPILARVGALSFAVAAWSLVGQAGWIVFGRHTQAPTAVKRTTSPGGVSSGA